jgi:hypothetical protein
MSNSGLIFSWPARRWFSWRFLAFFGISSAVHGVVFMLFQVVEKDRVTSPAREKEITFLSWEVPGHQALLAAVEAETPTAVLSHPLLPAGGELRTPMPSVLPERNTPLLQPRHPDTVRGVPGWLGGVPGPGGAP